MRSKYSRCLLVFVCLSAALLLPAGAESSETTKLVEIDGKTITREQLDTFFNAYFYRPDVREKLASLPDFQKEAVIARGRSQALDKLVERRLLLSAAEERFLTNDQVSQIVDKLTENRVEEIRSRTQSWVGFVRQLHERDVSLEDWKTYLRETILIQNFIHEETQASRRIRPVEMRRYYQEHRDQFRQPRRIVYRQILVDPEQCEKPGNEEDLARQIRQKLLNGASFARLAEKYSLDRDQTEGGLHRVEAPKNKPEWMPPAVDGLKPGEISEVHKTQAGCSIARLEKIIPARVAPYEEAQDSIRKRLLENRQRTAREKLIKELRENAQVKVLPEGREILGS